MAVFTICSRGIFTLKYRDLTLRKFSSNETLVIACDSYGGIGNLPLDHVQVSPEVVGYYTALLCLKECASIQAEPFCLVNLVSASFEPTGAGILRGIRQALAEAGIPDLPVNGSSEENFTVQQTGGGMTLLAKLEGDFVPPEVQAGDRLYLVGEPSVGDEVMCNQKKLLSLQMIKKLASLDACIEIVPLGSGGFSTELERYRSMGWRVPIFSTMEKYDRTAGPATAAIAVMRDQMIETEDGIPIRWIGRIEA